MFVYEIVGFSYIQAKDLYVLHMEYDSPGTTGKAVETVFVKSQFIEGGQIGVGQLCKVYRNQRGYCQGIEIV